MSIEDLRQVVAPPQAPVEAGSLTVRPDIEGRLGLKLPDDLYDFGMEYGSGTFGFQIIEVYNPFSSSYFDTIEEVCSTYRDLRRDEGPEFIPFRIYPEKPGLLPWGDEANGHIMFWLTQGDAREWPIVLYRNRATESDRWERRAMQLTTFLSKVIKGELHCNLWDDEAQRELMGIQFIPKTPG